MKEVIEYFSKVFHDLFKFFRYEEQEKETAVKTDEIVKERPKNLHSFINNRTYKLLRKYPEPKVSFPDEKGITKHIVNEVFKKWGRNKKIKYFNKVEPESATGSDLLLILRGDFEGEQRELRILYQSKMTKWKHDKKSPLAQIEFYGKWHDFLKINDQLNKRGAYILEEVYNGSKYRVAVFDGIGNKIKKIPLHELPLLQHKAQIEFSKLINAAPLYCFYRYNPKFAVNKQHSIAFGFTEMIRDYFDDEQKKRELNKKRRKLTFKEKEISKALFFCDGSSVFDILYDNGGFFYFGSNLGAIYENYKKQYENQLNKINLDEKGLDRGLFKPVSLSSPNERLFLKPAAPYETSGIYHDDIYTDSNGERFELKVPETEKDLGFRPASILVVDVD